jgi:predicted Zn-dependent protease
MVAIKESGKDWTAALTALDQLISVSPNTPLVHGRRARALMHLGRKREAIWAAIEELARRPNDEATFEILLHDQALLISEMNNAPAETLAMVENLVQLYTTKYHNLSNNS